MTLSRLVTISISSLRTFDIEAKIHYMIELIDFMIQHFLQEGILNMHFSLLLTGKLIIVGSILKLNVSIKELD